MDPRAEENPEREARGESYKLLERNQVTIAAPPDETDGAAPYSVSRAALSQSTSPAPSGGLPISMVAPRRSAEGSCD